MQDKYIRWVIHTVLLKKKGGYEYDLQKRVNFT